jgi:hypothetical protein
MIVYLPRGEKSPDAKRAKSDGIYLTDRAHENAQHDQEHIASRDYDSQRSGGKSERQLEQTKQR